MTWFEKIMPSRIKTERRTRSVPEGLWMKCAACDAVRAKGGVVTREAGPVKGGTTVIAFVQDPDGYKIELIQTDEKRG